MRASRWLAAIALVLTSAAGCSDETGPNPTGLDPMTILRVRVTPAVDTIWVADTISPGDQLALAAVVETRSGLRTDLPVAWSSSDASVAAVDEAGVVTARGWGTATIRASASEIGTAQITVMPRHQADAEPNLLASIAGGDAFTCAVSARERVHCWGRNSTGQLGGLQPDTVCVNEYIDDEEEPCALAPVRSSGGPFVQVDADSLHACAIGADGRAYCWGSGAFGRLGNGTTGERTEPTLVSGAHTFASVTTGGAHSCALTPAGAAWCWGSDEEGQLGNSLLATSTTPIPVDGGHTFVAISAGRAHTCAVAEDGRAYCWGEGYATQSPEALSTGLRFATVSAGRDHACALTEGGALYCWGDGEAGQLNGTPQGATTTPVQVPGTWTQVAAGGLHTCGVTSGGAVRCWGRYDLGEHGTATVGSGGTGLTTIFDGDVVSLTAGERHACAVLADGTGRCWGSNVMGAFGDGLQALLRRNPQRVRDLR